MKRLILAAAFLAAAVSTAAVSTAAAATLQVKIDGVASASGKLRVAVCDEASFLKHCTLGALAPARPGTVTVDVADVPAGNWAVLVYHDENDNGKLDRKQMGLPAEGYGFSNGATTKFGPPRFAQTSLAIGTAPVVAAITLQY